MRTNVGVALATLAAAAALAGCETRPHYVSNAQAVNDATVTANVKSVLVQDPETRGSNISVNTINGQVQLMGFVNSRAEAEEAVHDARGVPGVGSVNDELQINGGGAAVAAGAPVVGAVVDDHTITNEVTSALASNPETESSRITVTTSDGVVQLAGFVDSNQQRVAAGNVASSVQGVRRVDNDLRLNPAD